MSQKIIEVHIGRKSTVLEFYDELLKALKAPGWHGQSVNSLVDSMVYGGVNAVEPPYTVHIYGIADAAESVVEEIKTVQRAIAHACIERERATGIGVEVGLEFARNTGPTSDY